VQAYKSRSDTTTETRIEPAKPRPFEKKKNMPRNAAGMVRFLNHVT
jgi:hypothetical protein